MHDPLVILLISILLLQEVEGQNGGHNEEESDDGVEYAHAPLQAAVIRVEDHQALICLKVDLEQLLKDNGEQDARTWQRHHVKRSSVDIPIEVTLEGKREGTRRDGHCDVHDGVLHAEASHLQQPQHREYQERDEAVHDALVCTILPIVDFKLLDVAHEVDRSHQDADVRNNRLDEVAN